MKVIFGIRWMAIAVAGASQCSCLPAPAQSATNAPSVPVRTNILLHSDMLPPAPTVAKSPVDFFRELSALSPAERLAVLTNRPPENRKAILAKVREYAALKPDQRNLRLKATELRYYLLPLMRTPPTNRVAQLSLIPDDDRKMVEDHLKEWDSMPPALQTELLQHQDTIRYLLEIGGTTSPATAPNTLTNISAARRTKLEQGIQEWQTLSEAERDNMMGHFKQFFDLTANEQKKTLNTLSEAERRQIEKTLRNYAGLTPGQRNECLRSFNKFASMNLIERQQFLKNADKWKLMTPDERNAWRNIVEAAPLIPPSQANNPPLPPFPKTVVPRPRPLANNTN